MLKTNEDLHPQSREILQTFVKPTSVKFRDFAEHILATSDISLSYFASLLILRRSFQ